MELLQLIFNGIATGLIYSLFAVSFSLIYGTAKIFHFAHGMVFTVGAYFSFLFHIYLGLPIYLAIPISLIFTGAVGMGINWILYEPLKRREGSKLVILVASLGMYIFLEALISLIFTSNVRVLHRGGGSALTFWGICVTPMQVIIIVTVLVINTLLTLFFLRTETGHSIRALGQDAELAEVFGMSPRRITYIIFAIGSALAAIGASLYALDVGTIYPGVGMESLLICFVALVLGGMENIPGAAVGGFIVGMIYHLSIWRIEAKWQQVIAFSVVILVLIIKPKGLFHRGSK